MYSTILFIHVIATLGIVVAMATEAMTLRQLSGPSTRENSEALLDLLPGLRIFSSVCLLVLFFSGGYLTERLSMWQSAWPKVAVAIVVLFGALAGVSGQRLKRLRNAVHDSTGETSRMHIRAVDTSFFVISLSLRTGLILSAVFLMSVKPKLAESVCVGVALPLICWLGVGLLGTKQRDSAPAKQNRPSTT